MAVTLFAYNRADTAMHRLPPLFKLCALMLLCCVTFAGGATVSIKEILSVPVITRTALCLLTGVLAFVLSGARRQSLKPLSFVPLLGLAVTVFRTIYVYPAFNTDSNIAGTVLSVSAGTVLPEYVIEIAPGFAFNMNGFAGGILYTLRFFITALSAEAVFETTSSLEIKSALESVENAAARIIPPVKKLKAALIISLAINFIPDVFDTWRCVHLASLARSGTPSDSSCRKAGKKKNILNILRTTSLELQSLLSCLLYQAEIKRKAILNRS